MNGNANLGHPLKLTPQHICDNRKLEHCQAADYFRTQVFELLDVEEQEEVINFSKSFEILINNLEAEVVVLRKNNDYNYDGEEDYARRTSISDDFIMNAFTFLLKTNNKLATIYGQIVNLLSTLSNGKEIINHIFETLLYDYVIESLLSLTKSTDKNWNVHINPLTYDDTCMIKKFFGTNNTSLSYRNNKLKDISAYARELSDVDVINLSGVNLNTSDLSNLDKILKQKSDIKFWVFSNCSLGYLNDSQLYNIFKNLSQVKSIYLNYNNLEILSPSALNIIFSNLFSARMIKLENNSLGSMNNDSLRTIFTNLRNAKHISLDCTKLGSLSNDALDIIFSNLKGAVYLSLVDNEFSEEQRDYITKKYGRNYFWR